MELSQVLRGRPDGDRAHIKLDSADLVLPRQALALQRDVLTEMAQGHAVAILPTHAEVTTQEVANMLDVSRRHLVKLLEKGTLPFNIVIRTMIDALALPRQQPCELVFLALSTSTQSITIIQ